jgi:hypothetical protein
MNAARSVTAEELVRALKRRRAALPSEIGTFIIFEACEALLSGAAAQVSLDTIAISEEGIITVQGAPSATEEGAARSLHAVLTSLLVAAGPAPTPALMRLVEEGPLEGRWSLDQMRDDLEAALVPLNRTASRRVLSRLVRETGWGERPPARAPKGPGFNELDEELSSLLGVEHVPSPRVASSPASSPRVASSPASSPRVASSPASSPRVASSPAHAPEPRLAAARVRDDDTREDRIEPIGDDDEDVSFEERALERQATLLRTLPTESAEPVPSMPAAPRLRDLDSLSERPGSIAPKGRGTWLGLGLVALAVGLVGVTLVLRPDALARLRGEVAPPPKKQAIDLPTAPQAGDLIVEVTVERAQILRFVGRGPVTVEHLPLGIAHEFVALADGAAPTRVVVPRDAEWEKTPDGPLYEVAMQAGEALREGAPLELGDTLLPQDVGAPSSQLGRVRIVTTPRGAKVYQLIGFSPQGRIQDVPLARNDELLVWKAGYEPFSRVVTKADFADEAGRKVARLVVTLERKKR